MGDLRADLWEQREQLLAYLLSKVKANDLHAVQDAASDIREIDAQLRLLEKVASDAEFSARLRQPA